MVSIKRRVIQIANSTQLISLPRKWAQQFGIKKGDELDVDEKGSTLVVSTESGIYPRSKTEIDFRGKEKLIHRALSSLYRAGYDEIRIQFEKPSELELIQSTINRELIGFEVVEEGKNSILVKKVSSLEHGEFESILKRTFIFLLNTAEESTNALKSQDTDLLKNLALRDITINKLTDYCRRSLNKRESYFKYPGPGYMIIELLEKVSDDYRDMCRYASENRIKPCKYVLDMLSEINSLLRESYNLFYSFKLEEMEKFILKKDKISEAILTSTKKVGKKESVLLLFLNSMLNNTFYLNGPIMIEKL